MTWSTSAYACARPVLAELSAAAERAAVLVKFGVLRYASRPPVLRVHPCFAIALALAALGVFTPLLPAGLTATLLTTAAASFALCAILPLPELALRVLSLSSDVHSRRLAPLSPAAPSLDDDLDSEREAQRRVAQSLPARRVIPTLDPKDLAFGDLMARISHDLRTPLNAVMGFSEMMALELFGPLGDRRYQDYVHHIRDSAAQLLKSAEDTMALTALMASPQRREAACACNLEQLIAEAWSSLTRMAQARGITLSAYIPSEVEVLGDMRALRQIMVNLMAEAVHRTPAGEHIVIAAIADGELVEIAVTVARPSRNGGSLALSLARALLEMHGTTLIEIDGPSQGWRAVTALDRAAQPDFFVEGADNPAIGVPAC
jgi:signal transduction histidine kinase